MTQEKDQTHTATCWGEQPQSLKKETTGPEQQMNLFLLSKSLTPPRNNSFIRYIYIYTYLYFSIYIYVYIHIYTYIHMYRY